MNNIRRKYPFKDYLQKGKSLLILGPRGSGKSFYLQSLLKDLGTPTFHLDLLKSEHFEKYLKTPEHLRKEIAFQLKDKKKLFVFIDEIQKVPKLLNEVHSLIETYKEVCPFILTGSSARKLKKADSNLLAGRALYFPFYPFNHQEVDFSLSLDQILQFGTLPESFCEKDLSLRLAYLKTYTQLYLKEEILQEALVRNIAGFTKFLEVAAFMNASPIKYSKLAKQVNMHASSIQGHYQILEDTLLAIRLPAFTNSIKKQLQHMPKYYFFDNGVLNSLRGELNTELKESSYRYGQLFENLVVNEIYRLNRLEGYDYSIYHYRTNHGVEIDLILQKNIKSPPIAIEIKSSPNPSYQDVKSLNTLLEEYPQAKRYVLCRCEYPYEDNGIVFLPFLDGIKQVLETEA